MKLQQKKERKTEVQLESLQSRAGETDLSLKSSKVFSSFVVSLKVTKSRSEQLFPLSGSLFSIFEREKLVTKCQSD